MTQAHKPAHPKIRARQHELAELVRQSYKVTPTDRAVAIGQKPVTVWFTGLSGSGKSTIANEVELRLLNDGIHAMVLDGDIVRDGLSNDLGFTNKDRYENIRRVAEASKIMYDAGLVVLVALISPLDSARQFARDLYEPGEFIEVFVDTPPEVCQERDPKNLYARANAGEIKNMTGITQGYEAPKSPELHIDGTAPIDTNVDLILAAINDRQKQLDQSL